MAVTAGANQIPRRSSHVLDSELQDEVVLVDERTFEYHHLNATAGRVWRLIDSQRTVGDIADQLTEEFEVTAERLRQEVAALIGDLADVGLVEWAG